MTDNRGNLADQTSQVTLIASNWMQIPVQVSVTAVENGQRSE